MEKSYSNLINSFKQLDTEDKKEEILKNLLELLKLLYYFNKKNDITNEVLPVLSNYTNDEQYFDLLFSYIISLKEENAKLLENFQI